MKKFDVILDLLVQFGFLANAIYSLIVGNMTSAVLCGIFLIYSELSNIRRMIEERGE